MPQVELREGSSRMLVQCEFYWLDGQVQIDVICERCGEIAFKAQGYKIVSQIARGNDPVICEDCEAKRCRKCHKLPVPRDGDWVNSVCWNCRDKLTGEMRATLARLALVTNIPI